MSDTERKAINDNMQYVYQIICPGTYLHKNMKTFYENSIFLQVQGDTALCGLCALNNGYQEEKFDVNLLNSIADQQWISHYTDLHMPISELYLPFRDTNGWYSIEVLLKAVDNLGDSMVNLSGVLNSYFTKPGLSISEALNSSHSYPVSFLVRIPKTAHYTTIRIDASGHIYLLDSMKQCPIYMDEGFLSQYFEGIYKDPMFALYGFTFKNAIPKQPKTK